MSKVAKKPTPKPGEQEQGSGYKGEHIEGSRKGRVHALYDAEGPEAAWTHGLKLKLKEGTLRTWFGQWGRAKPKAKPPAKAKPSKTVPAEAVKVNGGAAVATN
jgi:hypothetical protein